MREFLAAAADAAFRADSLNGFGVSLTATGLAGSFFFAAFLAAAGFRPDLDAFPAVFPEQAGQKYGTSSLLTHSSLCVTPTHSK